MEFDLVFNELSVQNIDSNVEIARQWMSDFIETIRAFTAQGVKVSIRSNEYFYTIMLAPNYSISQWCKEANEKERRFIKNLATKTPLSQDLLNPKIQDIENNAGLSDAYHQGKSAIGLGVAYLLDTVAISFISDQSWDLSCLELDLIQLNDNDEIINQAVEIRHASRNIHIQDHSEWIQERIRTGVNDGEDIWERRKELFPSLEFCENVSKQIQSLYYGTPMLRQVEKKLFELENYCKSWKDGAFDLDLLPSKATPESESRLKDLEEKLTFKCPDGKKRIFSLHLRMTGAGAWRLHFSSELGICPELGTGKIIIGYIGKKIQ
ncbi:hypothetical protein Cylst_3907 [Cylindrospermum stagnale PCC 7417]|uniref:Uncharacterized protein n=1 Tax=Cylindrospermum stagnale PCC 7417 TaxID=56107 RepID=K9X079_9NOST|nr:hypothetical protein [Cylindrospermum stagnale]AFZ26020.1 hypothetical protein Cylst_3907 [Cylindrospermum stagnale PCC 7417]